jgi:pyruvate,water dikinase
VRVTAGPENRFVLALADCAGLSTGRVGGKAAGLAALAAAGLDVPAGFVVTTDAYSAAHGTGLGTAGAAAARALITGTALPPEVADGIRRAYLTLGADVPVAVRSSATAEDTADASFAGQQDTYLAVCGAEQVLRSVVDCWASLYQDRAVTYRERLGYTAVPAMAVVVQRMVDPHAAGVALTLDPATGDRDTVYVEAALGLGEGVVRGDVGVDRYWIGTAGSEVRVEVGDKSVAHRAVAGAPGVRLAAVATELAGRPALTDGQIRELADLCRRVEKAFGRPMDIEWAIDEERLWLLQARPETVWSRRAELPPVGTAVDWDPLHHASPPGAHWTTVNFGETAPGVLTPLAWTLWAGAGEAALRRAAYNLGVLDAEEMRPPSHPDGAWVKSFHGRAAMRIEFLALLGDRMPGTSGAEAVRSILGEPPVTLEFAPTRHRYPAIARRLPEVMALAPGRLRREAESTRLWWRESVTAAPALDLAGARRLFAAAEQNFASTLALQTTAVIAVVQPLYQALERLTAKVGVGDMAALSSGYTGFAEVLVVEELWQAAHGRTTVAAIVAEHGFHGPLEGEVSSRVWRERPEILESLLETYRDREDPRHVAARQRATRLRLEAEVLAAVPRPARPAVRGLFAVCARRIPLRGVGKRSFLQSIDVARAAARRVGELLVADGVLAAVDDVFFLTTKELTGQLPADTGGLVDRRRARREVYRTLSIPPAWRGDCVPVDGPIPTGPTITGIGVSAGVVEGVVRVLESSDTADFRPDEVLVAPCTDPSWSSIMFVSSALVVDIGGALSHASMVARELGIPAVVNTGDGTRRLRTGDRVRVDGTSGIVEILS